MRTIQEAARMLKEEDAGTAITANCIRNMVLAGEIAHVRVGVKRLLDYDSLLNLLKNPPAQTESHSDIGTIRRVV
jgi:aspartate-semialdehyde dehydrogenase